MSKTETPSSCNNLVARDIKNANIVNLWAFAWASSLLLVSFLSEYEWYAATWIISLGFIFHTGIGIKMIFAFKQFINQADELEKKIQLDALALSVGITIIVFSSYSILEKSANVPALTPAYLIVTISVAYIVGIIAGRRHFR